MQSRLLRSCFLLALLAPCAAPATPLWAASAAPAPARVQQNPAAVLDAMLSRFANEMVPLVEAMPADKFNFAPTNGQFQGVRTFAQQVVHVAQANDHYFGSISSVPPPQIPNASTLQAKPAVLKALKDSIAYGHQVLATITPDNAFAPVGGSRSRTRAGTAAAAIAHGYDHYGQLVEYLRMNGIVPPASRH